MQFFFALLCLACDNKVHSTSHPHIFTLKLNHFARLGMVQLGPGFEELSNAEFLRILGKIRWNVTVFSKMSEFFIYLNNGFCRLIFLPWSSESLESRTQFSKLPFEITKRLTGSRVCSCCFRKSRIFCAIRDLIPIYYPALKCLFSGSRPI